MLGGAVATRDVGRLNQEKSFEKSKSNRDDRAADR